MSADIENAVKEYFTCLEHHNTQPREKTTPYKVPAKPWKMVGTDVFMINTEKLSCIVECYSKVPVVKRVESLSAKYLITAAKVLFAEIGLFRKLV